MSRETHDEFAVVYCLGLLYHLDAPDLFSVLENVSGVCRRMLVVDTLISLAPEREVSHRGRAYEGARVREHDDDDSDEARRSRLLRSIDNTFAFRLTLASLVRALNDVGFDSVLECRAPPEPFKPEDRVTLVALKGEPVEISTYPWVNGMSEADLEKRLHGA